MSLKQLLNEHEENRSLLILDGHNLIFRTIFPAQNEIDKTDTQDETFIYWKTMFLSSLKFTIEKFKPTDFILTFDSKESWRKEVYPNYKANRKAARDASKVDFKKFFPVLQEFIEDLQKAFQNLKIVCLEGAEGDDIIAVASETFKGNITIISTDKDLYQLLTRKNVKQWSPIDKKFVTVLNPETFLNVKILGGDKNDNIPSIFPRCGLKTVEKLMRDDFITQLYNEEYVCQEKVREMFVEKYKLEPTQILENYKRNCQLIDFKYIPTELKMKIAEELNRTDRGKFSGRKFNDFVFKHKLKTISERANEYSEVFGKL